MSKEIKRKMKIQESTTMQKVVFLIFFLIGAVITFTFSANLLTYFVDSNLQGIVHHTTGEYRAMDFENDKHIDRILKMENGERKVRKTSYFSNWAVDLYVDSPNQTRFWFKPIFSLLAFIIFFGVNFAVCISSLLPKELGYFRQKIQREIVTSLDYIYSLRYGEFLRYEPPGIREELANADLEKLYELSSELNLSIDDLQIIKNSIYWENESVIYKFFHPIKGISLYLRNHFTEKYSNSILSFVYIGAAFLIIIIGLRGLKFIPSSEPSLVFFALGLEFTILITYALTLMFSKPEEQAQTNETNSGDKLISSDRQMEKLLRAFANWNKKAKS